MSQNELNTDNYSVLLAEYNRKQEKIRRVKDQLIYELTIFYKEVEQLYILPDTKLFKTITDKIKYLKKELGELE